MNNDIGIQFENNRFVIPVENGTPYVYIYLDEDWKKQIADTNIIWGKDLQFIQKYEWTKVGNSIYRNKIKDDKERFPE